MERIAYSGCPLCDNVMVAPVGRVSCTHHRAWREPLPAEMVWLTCLDCGHVFTSGYFDAEALDVVCTVLPEQDDPQKQRVRWARTVKTVADLSPPPGRWLDVGFGNGGAMFLADEWGYNVAGIDAREQSVDALRSAGYTNVHHVALADYRTDEPFDVVSLFDVLEHTPHPLHELTHVRSLLRRGGLVVVSCPNMDCHAWRLADAAGANPYWGEIEHYHNFTRQRLTDLLVVAGFRVVSFDVSARWLFGMEIVASAS